MGRILALDYGAVRTGIAVTDPLQIIATPLTTEPTKTLLDWLKSYLQKEQVDGIVLGIPNNNFGAENAILKTVLEFKKKLEETWPSVPIHEMDERFTSSMAGKVIRESGLSKMDRRDKGRVDRLSAVLILQSFMERQSKM